MCACACLSSLRQSSSVYTCLFRKLVHIHVSSPAMINKLILLVFLTVIIQFANALPVNETNKVYDQRQTGDYNIHISLKDVKIVALLGGNMGGNEDYDYNYDYADMTIKPTPTGGINGTNSTSTTTSMTPTTNKASTSEDIDSITTTDGIVEITPHTSPKPSLFSNVTGSPQIVNKEPVKNASKPLHSNNENLNNIPVQVVVTPVQILLESKQNRTTKPVEPILTTTPSIFVPQRDCIEGFRKDKNGNCRPKPRKQPQQTQTLLRKLIQLSRRLQPKHQMQIQ